MSKRAYLPFLIEKAIFGLLKPDMLTELIWTVRENYPKKKGTGSSGTGAGYTPARQQHFSFYLAIKSHFLLIFTLDYG